MTISTWLLMLTLAAGSGTSEAISSDSSTPPSAAENGRPSGNCWINGTWYNPCPSEDQDPWTLEPPPEKLPPN